MGVRERILTVRIMEKLQAHPAYAKTLGICASVVQRPEAEGKKEK